MVDKAIAFCFTAMFIYRTKLKSFLNRHKTRVSGISKSTESNILDKDKTLYCVTKVVMPTSPLWTDQPKSL